MSGKSISNSATKPPDHEWNGSRYPRVTLEVHRDFLVVNRLGKAEN